MVITTRADEKWQLGHITTTEEVLSLPLLVDFVDTSRALGLRRTEAYERVRQGTYPVPLLDAGHGRKAKRTDILNYLGIGSTSGPPTSPPAPDPTAIVRAAVAVDPDGGFSAVRRAARAAGVMCDDADLRATYARVLRGAAA